MFPLVVIAQKIETLIAMGTEVKGLVVKGQMFILAQFYVKNLLHNGYTDFHQTW